MRTTALILLLFLLVGGTALAVAIRERTTRVTEASDGGSANGASSRPVISPGGTLVVFDSAATNLTSDGNGTVRDVFSRDLETGRTFLVSAGIDGAPADGPSDSAVLAAKASPIVFTSRATNLVADDTNGARDVFARFGGAPPVRLSVGADGAQANGPSYQPDVSRDGRRVVFTSLADNLVPNDTNGVEDVFLRDLATGVTRRISERGGRSAKGRSRAPAISPDGLWVSFESTAADLVSRDTNGVPDVFLANLDSGRIQRVSVNSAERQQDRAVTPPFVTVSDVSRGGSYVVWDSDATNLVARDRNRDTDVFIRDVRRGRTGLVSRAVSGHQGNNDSYFPSISSDARFVAFTSFAANLWPTDRAGEDVFVHDRRVRVTVPLTVTSRGGLRPRESTRQLLRRPSFSEGARRIAFTSTAALTPGDTSGIEDVFVRATDPPQGRIVRAPRGVTRDRRPRYRLAADDPAAVFVCRIDWGKPFFCPAAGRLPRLSRGRHRLTVRAGGPGMLFDAVADIRSFRVR